MNVTVIHHDPLAQGKLILPKKLEAEFWTTRTVLSDCRQTEFRDGLLEKLGVGVLVRKNFFLADCLCKNNFF